MEEFIDNAKVIMGTLGHKVFEPLTKPIQAQENDTVITGNKFFLKRAIRNIGTVEAVGNQTADGFVVFEGSHISPEDDNTIPAAIKEQRKKAQIDKNNILKENMLFTSPSYAAMFVIGKSANGLTSWKTEGGKTLKSLESEEI